MRSHRLKATDIRQYMVRHFDGVVGGLTPLCFETLHRGPSEKGNEIFGSLKVREYLE
jgi:hypothetical protein